MLIYLKAMLTNLSPYRLCASILDSALPEFVAAYTTCGNAGMLINWRRAAAIMPFEVSFASSHLLRLLDLFPVPLS